VLIATISEHQFKYKTESAISDQLRSLRAERNVSYRKEGRQVFLPLARPLLTGAQSVREHLAERRHHLPPCRPALPFGAFSMLIQQHRDRREVLPSFRDMANFAFL
jgi:hypothetical protein